MNIGNRIIKLRKNEKLSQEILAEKLGVTRQTISNWELNITKPDITQIKKISKIFNISIDELLDNNIRDIIEKKVTNTEKLTNKTTKNIRLIIITMYLIILLSAIGFTIYLLSNKDFTKEYQQEIVCEIDGGKVFLTINTTTNDDEVMEDYIIEVKEMSKESNGYTHIEKYKAGDSLIEASNSLITAKNILVSSGARCK